jgi:hypothetical protein
MFRAPGSGSVASLGVFCEGNNRKFEPSQGFSRGKDGMRIYGPPRGSEIKVSWELEVKRSRSRSEELSCDF